MAEYTIEDAKFVEWLLQGVMFPKEEKKSATFVWKLEKT